MDRATAERLAPRVKVMKAIAHPTRLYIVEELARGERCVHELTDMVGADISTVSKHLALLKSVGIVKDERRGNEVYYSLALRCVLGFFECVEEVLAHGSSECSAPSCRARA
ncbi:MAG: winged helix-turn-helix transcriptional regulator [Candidatus Eisenbacteria bacterium]|nr:winged helix-turn-helix transcriptional regulator [Candidatus Eisenbacteria bacterium]